MTHRDDYDFSQFKGQFDSAMTPESDFAARMQKMLERESGEANQPRKATVIATPSRTGTTVPAPGRRTHPLTIAASILVVLAVVVSSVWVLGGTQLEGDYASAPSGIATLPADAAVTPAADVPVSESLVIPFDVTSYSNVYTLDVIDGVAYTSHAEPAPANSQAFHSEILTAWDIEQGEKLWELEGYSVWNLTLSNGVVVAFTTEIPTQEELTEGTEFWPATSIVALDAETGDVLWEHIVDGSELSRMWELDFVVIDDVVTTVSPDGNMTGLDLRSGDERWSAAIDMGEGWVADYYLEDAAEPTKVTMHAVSMTAWQGQVAIANGDGLVNLIDAATGDITASHEIGANSPAGLINLEALPNTLLLTHGDNGSDLTAFDPETGDVLWEREFDGDLRVEVAENGMIAVNSHIWESGNFIMRILGRGGHSTYQFLWIDGATGEDVLATERGRIDGPVFSMTDGEHLCTNTDQFVCYNQAGTRHIIPNGPWAQAFFEDGAMYFDRDDGLYRVDLP